MSTVFKHGCPNCGYKSKDKLLGGWFKIYQCNNCGQQFCYKCGKYQKNCPSCGSDSKREIGHVPVPV